MNPNRGYSVIFIYVLQLIKLKRTLTCVNKCVIPMPPSYESVLSYPVVAFFVIVIDYNRIVINYNCPKQVSNHSGNRLHRIVIDYKYMGLR